MILRVYLEISFECFFFAIPSDVPLGFSSGVLPGISLRVSTRDISGISTAVPLRISGGSYIVPGVSHGMSSDFSPLIC